MGGWDLNVSVGGYVCGQMIELGCKYYLNSKPTPEHLITRTQSSTHTQIRHTYTYNDPVGRWVRVWVSVLYSSLTHTLVFTVSGIDSSTIFNHLLSKIFSLFWIRFDLDVIQINSKTCFLSFCLRGPENHFIHSFDRNITNLWTKSKFEMTKHSLPFIRNIWNENEKININQSTTNIWAKDFYEFKRRNCFV